MARLNKREQKYINSSLGYSTPPAARPILALADIVIDKGGIVSDITCERTQLRIHFVNQPDDSYIFRSFRN